MSEDDKASVVEEKKTSDEVVESKEVIKEEVINKKSKVSPRKSLWAIFGGGFMGSLFFLLFWKQGLGLNIFVYTFFVLLFVQLTKYVIHKKVYYTFWDIFQIPILIIAFGSLLNDSRSFNAITVLIFLFVLPVLGYLSVYPETIKKFSFVNSCAIFMQQLVSPFVSIPDFLSSSFRFRPGRVVTPNSIKLIIGVVITLPVMCVLTMLLMSADEAFQNLVKMVIDGINTFIKVVLNFDNVWDFMVLIILVLIGIFVSLGYIFAALKFKLVDFAYEQKEKGLDLIISNVVLAGINFIFIIFVLIQFQYLFFGAGDMSSLGLTYSEYARRGFAELQMVSIIVFSIIYVILRFGKKSSNLVLNITKINLVILLLSTLVIVFSALFRMNLYMDAYGYTLMRFYPYVFMVYQFIIFVYLFPSVFNRKVFRQFSLFAFSLFLVIMMILAWVSPERIVAYKNIARAQDGEFLDTNYLIGLSSDGWIPLLNKDINGSRIMACQIVGRNKENLDNYSWQENSVAKFLSSKTIYQYVQKYIDDGELSYDEYLNVCDSFIEKDIDKFSDRYIELVESNQFSDVYDELWLSQFVDLSDEVREGAYVVQNVTRIDNTKSDKYIDWGGVVTSGLSQNYRYNLRYPNGDYECYEGDVSVNVQNGEVKISGDEVFPIAYGTGSYYMRSYRAGEDYSKGILKGLNDNNFSKYTLTKCYGDNRY